MESEAKVRPTLRMADQLQPLAPGVEEGCIPTMEDFGQKGKKVAPMESYLEVSLKENQNMEASQRQGLPFKL